jgi:hypothetical protein
MKAALYPFLVRGGFDLQQYLKPCEGDPSANASGLALRKALMDKSF